MLTRVDVQSENPFYLNIRDARPSDSIIVEKIDGLDPPAINLHMGDYARDGGFYGGRRVPPRDVNFTLRLNPNPKFGESVSGLRRLLYKAFLDPFAQADNTRIVLKDDELPDRFVSGYTEKFESDIFSDEPIVEIVMLCPNPYIIDVDATVVSASGPTVPFVYAGSAEAGMEITAVLTAASPYLTFDLNGERVRLSYAFEAGDRVYLNTIPGSRQVRINRVIGGVDTPIDALYTLDWSASKWIYLHSVQNTLRVYGNTANASIASIETITFQATHWGI